MEAELKKVETKLDEIQDQIYIISGVAGGLCLILIIAVLVIAVKLSKLRHEMSKQNHSRSVTEEDLSKRGFSAYTGKTEVSAPMQTIAVAPPVQQPSFSPQITSPIRQEGFSYDNTGYNDQQQRSRLGNPNGNGGHHTNGGHQSHLGGHNVHGVQVLPKNPPPPRGAPQTDGFY